MNNINIEDWLKRCEQFFILHPSEYARTTSGQVDEMFTLYNDKLSPKESGKYCSKCCGRVYKRLKQHYEKIKNTNE